MIGTCSGTHIVNQGVSDLLQHPTLSEAESEARPPQGAVASERPLHDADPHLGTALSRLQTAISGDKPFLAKRSVNVVAKAGRV
jgi:hypothetical protein